MKRVLIITIILTSSFVLYSQKYELKRKAETIQFLQKIVRDGQLISTSHTGYASMPSRQWYSFAFLLSLTNTDELLKMTNDKSACLRLYAYIGLVHFKYSDTSKVKIYLSADTSELSSIEGCIFRQTTISRAINEISIWYAEKPMNDFLIALQIDKKYKTSLFQDIVNDRQIKRYQKKITDNYSHQRSIKQ